MEKTLTRRKKKIVNNRFKILKNIKKIIKT